jgi:hypothetical protein
MLTLDRENRCGPEMALAFIASALAGTCAPLNPHFTAAERVLSHGTDLPARRCILASLMRCKELDIYPLHKDKF